jgi:hypothetical protein
MISICLNLFSKLIPNWSCCLQDMDSSTEAINRLQGVILYSSTGEGMRLEYPTFRDYLNFLLLYLSSNSSCRVYLELIAEAKCDLYFLTMPF